MRKKRRSQQLEAERENVEDEVRGRNWEFRLDQVVWGDLDEDLTSESDSLADSSSSFSSDATGSFSSGSLSGRHHHDDVILEEDLQNEANVQPKSAAIFLNIGFEDLTLQASGFLEQQHRYDLSKSTVAGNLKSSLDTRRENFETKRAKQQREGDLFLMPGSKQLVQPTAKSRASRFRMGSWKTPSVADSTPVDPFDTKF